MNFGASCDAETGGLSGVAFTAAATATDVGIAGVTWFSCSETGSLICNNDSLSAESILLCAASQIPKTK